MQTLKKSLLTVVSLLVGVVLIGATASAQSSGGIGGRPANPDPENARTQSIFIFNLDHNESVTDTILVSNNSDETKTIDLYAVDGVVTNTGSYTCSQLSEVKQDVGSWIAIDKGTVTLDAGKSEKVNFQLTMPAGIDVGEHNGCIVFQEQSSDDSASGNVRVLTRQAIRVAVTVPGELKRDISIASFDVGSLKGDPTFNLSVKNTGNVSADVDTKVRLTTLLGTSVYENGGGYPVLANKQLDLSFVNENPPLFGGWYYASAAISYDKRPGQFGTSDPSNIATIDSERILLFIAPSPAGFVILLVLLAALVTAAVWFILRRKQRDEITKTLAPYKVKKGDNIQSIAAHAGIGWKKLASLNQLSAPYVLEPGQTLNIPKKTKQQSKKIKEPPIN